MQRLPTSSPSRTPLRAGDDISNPTPLQKFLFRSVAMLSCTRRYVENPGRLALVVFYIPFLSLHRQGVSSQRSLLYLVFGTYGKSRSEVVQMRSESSASEMKGRECAGVARSDAPIDAANVLAARSKGAELVLVADSKTQTGNSTYRSTCSKPVSENG